MRTAAGVISALLLAPGCSGSEGANCILIGAESGIMAQLHPVLTPHPGERFTVTTCVDSTCSDHEVRGRAAGRAVDLGFGGDSLTDGSRRTVSVTIEDETGRVVFDGRRVVRPELFEPNGPECEPHAWTVNLRAVGTDRLRVLETPA